MNEKYCTTCKILKPFRDFCKHCRRKDGLESSCKKCCDLYQNSYKKTKKGLIARIYSGQRLRSRVRNHPQPDYSLPELRNWVFAQPNFEPLFDGWVSSGYEKYSRPSCDRLDDYKAYTFENLRLVTWGENDQKGNDDMKNGINNKGCAPVKQFTKEGLYLCIFPSISIAGRVTNICRTSIYKCCNGAYRHAGGFKWERA